MKQNRPFPPVHHQPPPEPTPPPTRLTVMRQRLNSFYTRFRPIILVAAGIAIALASMLIYNTTQPTPQRLTQKDIDAAVERSLESMKPRPPHSVKAYDVIRPSVVRVEALLPQSESKEGKNEGSLGSGVVINDMGIILTSLHVVKNAVEVRVTFADGFESKASIIATEPANDLAALRPHVIPDDLIPATLTGSAGLSVGDEVFAVGNPFGISDSLSAGVVSGLGRNFKSTRTGQLLTNLIQFDAAVNPGNSGGPLVNRDGEVVGIVAALVNPTEQDVFIGIGFAVTLESAGGIMGTPPF